MRDHELANTLPSMAAGKLYSSNQASFIEPYFTPITIYWYIGLYYRAPLTVISIFTPLILLVKYIYIIKQKGTRHTEFLTL